MKPSEDALAVVSLIALLATMPGASARRAGGSSIAAAPHSAPAARARSRHTGPLTSRARKHVVVGLGGLMLATACSGSSTVVVTHSRGTLIVDWTIDGAKEPRDCSENAATTIDVSVQSNSGESGYQADCAAFATSIDLPAGSYDATAVLIDAAGNDRTTPIDIPPFRISASHVFTVPIDFPADSFL